MAHDPGIRHFLLGSTPAVTLVMAAFVAACNNPSNPAGGIACTEEYRYALNVQVRDSITGVDVPAPMIISAREGSFADTSRYARDPVTGIPFASWPLVGERAGTYTVRVVANGYQNWEQTGIRVSKNVCHVIPVTITARLQK